MARRLGGRLNPEFFIRLGAVLGFAGNYALIAWTLLVLPSSEWLGPVGVQAAGLALSVLTIVAFAKRRARNATNFGLIAVLASAVALLSLPGVIGGGVALTGAVWGVVATYGAPPKDAA